MRMPLNIPTRIPEPGFYYHYKHDLAGPINNYAYEVIGNGFHTEDDCRPIDHNLVVYRPIYESTVYKAGKFYDIRPLSMFMESVVVPIKQADQEPTQQSTQQPTDSSFVNDSEPKLLPRFAKIDDPSIVSALEEIKNKMYGR